MPNSLVEIKSQAFTACHSLSYISLPDSLKKIGGGCFQYCNIKNLSHPQIKIENGFVIKDNCLLYISISDEKEIVIPETVTSIDSAAFLGGIIKSCGLAKIA